MLIAYLIDMGVASDVEELPIDDLVEFYKKAKAKFDEDEAFKLKSQ